MRRPQMLKVRWKLLDMVSDNSSNLTLFNILFVYLVIDCCIMRVSDNDMAGYLRSHNNYIVVVKRSHDVITDKVLFLSSNCEELI